MLGPATTTAALAGFMDSKMLECFLDTLVEFGQPTTDLRHNLVAVDRLHSGVALVLSLGLGLGIILVEFLRGGAKVFMPRRRYLFIQRLYRLSEFMFLHGHSKNSIK